ARRSWQAHHDEPSDAAKTGPLLNLDRYRYRLHLLRTNLLGADEERHLRVELALARRGRGAERHLELRRRVLLPRLLLAHRIGVGQLRLLDAHLLAGELDLQRRLL